MSKEKKIIVEFGLKSITMNDGIAIDKHKITRVSGVLSKSMITVIKSSLAKAEDLIEE